MRRFRGGPRRSGLAKPATGAAMRRRRRPVRRAANLGSGGPDPSTGSTTARHLRKAGGAMGTSASAIKDAASFFILVFLRFQDLVLTMIFLSGGIISQSCEYLQIKKMKNMTYAKHLATKAPEFVPLVNHCLGIKVVDWFTPVGSVPATPSTNQALHGLLAEEAQGIIRGALLILGDLFRNRKCLRGVNMGTFVFDKISGRTMLRDEGEVTGLIGPNQVDDNVRELAAVLYQCIFVNNNINVESLPEVYHGLLPMMCSEGNRMWYAIVNDTSLIPLENRLEAYVRIYDQLIDVVGSQSSTEFRDILLEIIIPTDWHKLIESNAWLLQFYCGSVYDSQDTSQEKQVKEFGRYYRNSAAHVLGSSDARIGRADLAGLQYSFSPLTISSLARALQRRGWLKGSKILTLM